MCLGGSILLDVESGHRRDTLNLLEHSGSREENMEGSINSLDFNPPHPQC